MRPRIALRGLGVLIGGVTLLVPSLALAVPENDRAGAELRPYVKASGISGAINSIGSDTLNNLMTLWAEGFRRQYPNVRIQVEGKGSSTAPPALIEGTAQLGPMSRLMKSTEVDKFESRYGYEPAAYPVAVDALAVYVNKDNPLKAITMEQVDAAFSKSRRRGASLDLKTWGQLGLTGDWFAASISLYGRNSASGTYGFFKEQALKNGDFKDQVKEQPGSGSVVQAVTEDRYGMGYSGIGYTTSGIRMVPVAEKTGGTPVAPTLENTRNGTYPLWRYLYVYVNQAPGKPLSPIVREFLKYIYSQEGQSDVNKDGYFPLDASVAEKHVRNIK